MAISGSCLCGGVRFEIDEAAGPFEICHCTRCRKTSGAAGLPAVVVETKSYRFLEGADLIRRYEAPILYEPPAYESIFCARCGSQVPPAEPSGDHLEIAAGLFDDDLRIRPDKHIMVELKAPWDTITDDLPQLTLRQLIRQRHGYHLPDDFRLRTHGDTDPS